MNYKFKQHTTLALSWGLLFVTLITALITNDYIYMVILFGVIPIIILTLKTLLRTYMDEDYANTN